MRIFIFTCFTFITLISRISFASNSLLFGLKPAISGTVLNQQSEPVIGAHIYVQGTLTGAMTDLQGKFELHNIKPGQYTILISALGYRTITENIEVSENNPALVLITIQDDAFLIPEVLITGKSDRLFSRIPGSASFINSREIGKISPLSGNEVFRRSPGVHVVDEEGAGMRVNIGIRCLDPDRSRSLLMLDDGIPVALAPYGEPEMYYTPPIDRMSGVEILKGSGQILYGPQTIGGVINYLTQAPPAEASGKVRLQAGQGGYLSALASYGNTSGNTGYNITLLKKRADKLGITSLDITDINGKMVLNIHDKSVISLKLGFYNESSNATYIGQTQTMYDQGDHDDIHMAPDDLLTVRRYSASIHHEYTWNAKTRLKTTTFAYTTSRDWRRQDFVSNNPGTAKPANWTGVTWGDENISGGAIFMRKTTANRNRQFEVAGMETRLEHEYSLLGITHTLKSGVRYLYENANEQRINGSAPNVNSGALVEDESRPGKAISAFMHQTSELSSTFGLHYGLRLESFDYGRNIDRRTFTINSQNVLKDTVLNQSNRVQQWIPGAGFTWKPSDKVGIFGGIHTGFAPPRTKDAISNIGEVYNLSAEKSINTELGIRTNVIHGVQAEITGFHMNFSNQIIPVSESSGGTGTGLVNGGSTIHQGIECALNVNVAELAGWSKTSVTFNTNITFTDAHFTGDRVQNGERLEGNKTPYAPSWLVNSSIYLETLQGFSMRLGSNFVSGQYADELNTYTATPDGRIGFIPAYLTLDGNIGYKVSKWNTAFTISVKNITNERYIASRRPQGIRVGLPRWFIVGAEYNF